MLQRRIAARAPDMRTAEAVLGFLDQAAEQVAREIEASSQAFDTLIAKYRDRADTADRMQRELDALRADLEAMGDDEVSAPRRAALAAQIADVEEVVAANTDLIAAISAGMDRLNATLNGLEAYALELDTLRRRFDGVAANSDAAELLARIDA